MCSDHQTRNPRIGSLSARTLPLLVLAIWFLVPESVLAQPAPQPAAQVPADEAAAEQPAEQSSPLLVEPSSPGALFDAVVLMTDLGRPNLANGYLQKLLESKPDDAALLAMLSLIHI